MQKSIKVSVNELSQVLKPVIQDGRPPGGYRRSPTTSPLRINLSKTFRALLPTERSLAGAAKRSSRARRLETPRNMPGGTSSRM